MKKQIFILAIAFIGFTSCNKQGLVEQKKMPLDKSSSLMYSINRILSDQQISSIANLHNLYLDTFFSQINVATVTESELNSVISPYYSQFESQYNLNLIFPTEQNIDSAISQYIHNQNDFNTLKSDVENLMLNLNISNSNCYWNLVNRIDSLKSNAASNFQGTDLDCAYSMLEILKKSSYYWLPTAAGGSGLGSSKLQDYLDSNFDPNYIPSMSISEILGRTALADGTSMMWFCMVVGISGAVNPALIPGAILGYFGARVGGASITAFFQYLIYLD